MLHLVTQRGQPYASVRRCCEMCGVASGPYWPGSDPSSWTDDEEVWREAEDNCTKTNTSVDLSLAVEMSDKQYDVVKRTASIITPVNSNPVPVDEEFDDDFGEEDPLGEPA